MLCLHLEYFTLCEPGTLKSEEKLRVFKKVNIMSLLFILAPLCVQPETLCCLNTLHLRLLSFFRRWFVAFYRNLNISPPTAIPDRLQLFAIRTEDNESLPSLRYHTHSWMCYVPGSTSPPPPAISRFPPSALFDAPRSDHLPGDRSILACTGPPPSTPVVPVLSHNT